LTPVDFLAGKAVGCFVHEGVQQRGGFVISIVYLSFEALCRVGGLFFYLSATSSVCDLFAWLFDCCLLCCEARKGVVSYMYVGGCEEVGCFSIGCLVRSLSG